MKLVVDNVSDAAASAIGSDAIEVARDEIKLLLREIQARIPESQMSPCVTWSMGTLSLRAGLEFAVYPSAASRARQMAQAMSEMV